MRYLLISGDKGARKSALIARLKAGLNLKIGGGSIATMEPLGPTAAAPIYIHPIVGQRRFEYENLVGYCNNQKATGCPTAFIDSHSIYSNQLLR